MKQGGKCLDLRRVGAVEGGVTSSVVGCDALLSVLRRLV